jgi:hypothetical protein
LDCKIGLVGIVEPHGALDKGEGEFRENLDEFYTEFTRDAKGEEDCLSEMKDGLI